MSDIKWTPAQEQAIKTKGKGVVVSAAAGSGKTAVLIERIVRILSDEKNKVPADKLLAVTFTNKAAAQMRDKLNDAFEEKIKNDPDNKWLLSQQNLLQLAKISTINSFCLELVKENTDKTEFQGGISIMDETMQKKLLEESIAEALEELCANEPEKYSIIYNAFFLKSNRIEIMIEELYSFLRSLPFREKWIKESRKMYENADYFISNMFDSAEKIAQKIESNIAVMRNIYGYVCPVGDGEYTMAKAFPALADCIAVHDENLGALKKLIMNKDFNGLTTFNPKLKKLPGTMTDKKNVPEDIQLIINDVKANFKAANEIIKDFYGEIKNMFCVDKETFKQNILKINEIFDILVQLVERTEQIADEEKHEKNMADFSDVELITKNLLIEDTEDGYKRTELAEEIRNSHMYEIILIDEFQDVNNLQELIFRAISDSDDVRYMGKNLFVVGDIKQAIYRFRLTNPELFAHSLEEAEKEENQEFLEAINLQQNFRSRKEVVDFVNFMFDKLMDKNSGGVSYAEKDHLIMGAEYTPREEPVEIMLIPTEKDDEDKKEYSNENTAVAKRIKSLLESGHPVCDKGVDRPCRPSDICVLVSTNSEIKVMSQALEKVGLQAYAEDKEGYLKSTEIMLTLDILRVVDNPMNDLALTAVMMSPIMNFTADEMAIVRSKSQNHIYQILTASDRSKKEENKLQKDKGAVKEAEFIDMLDEDLQIKCENAYKMIDALIYNSLTMSLERFIRKIYDDTDIMALTSVYVDSDKKRANLRLLLEYAESFSKNSKEGVTGFLRYIDSVYKNEKAFQNAVTLKSAGESVHVLTYHSSKGLEFPFVFVCQLDNNFFGSDKDYIRLHNNKGFAFNYQNGEHLLECTNPYYSNLKNICCNEDRSEKMRVFYVACTRAKEKLFISYYLKSNKRTTVEKIFDKQRKLAERMVDIGNGKIPEESVLAHDTMLSWVTMAFAKLPNNKPFMEWLGSDHVITNDDERYNDLSFEFNILDPSEVPADESRQTADACFDDKIVGELIKKYIFNYKLSKNAMPAKMSVTEIVKEEKEHEYKDKSPEFFPNLPRLDDELDKLTAAERGTFTHKFMELAHYENAEADVKGELERLKNGGYFSPKEADGIYLDRLENFFKSEFYKRMKKSSEIMREEKFLVSVKDLKLDKELVDFIGDETMIQGIADCIFKEDDGYVIVDYKTDRFKEREEIKEYGTQLKLYKAAFEFLLNEKIKSCYIYSFWLNEGLEVKM